MNKASLALDLKAAKDLKLSKLSSGRGNAARSYRSYTSSNKSPNISPRKYPDSSSTPRTSQTHSRAHTYVTQTNRTGSTSPMNADAKFNDDSAFMISETDRGNFELKNDKDPSKTSGDVTERSVNENADEMMFLKNKVKESENSFKDLIKENEELRSKMGTLVKSIEERRSTERIGSLEEKIKKLELQLAFERDQKEQYKERFESAIKTNPLFRGLPFDTLDDKVEKYTMKMQEKFNDFIVSIQSQFSDFLLESRQDLEDVKLSVKSEFRTSQFSEGSTLTSSQKNSNSKSQIIKRMPETPTKSVNSSSPKSSNSVNKPSSDPLNRSTTSLGSRPSISSIAKHDQDKLECLVGLPRSLTPGANKKKTIDKNGPGTVEKGKKKDDKKLNESSESLNKEEGGTGVSGNSKNSTKSQNKKTAPPKDKTRLKSDALLMQFRKK